MKIALSLFALLAVNVAVAQDLQESEVPANVLQVVKSEYPNATDVEWEMEKGHYEVEFEINRADHKMLIDKSGKVLYHKGELTENDLPEAVMKTIQSKYADRKIDDVDIITRDGKTYFEIELDGKIMDDEILISADGKIEKENKSWYNF